mmetsp:Transcript_49503/g.92705  ORF Transcript_49503/g.92705 Transcript_49503/m.92705 type:complete len:265 (+) Transcript_49503:1215-2009(+)
MPMLGGVLFTTRLNFDSSQMISILSVGAVRATCDISICGYHRQRVQPATTCILRHRSYPTFELHKLVLHHELNALRIMHEDAVDNVQTEEDASLPPFYSLVDEEHCQQNEADCVKGRIAKERPPGQFQWHGRGDRARTDHKEHVEDCRAHNGSYADVRLCDPGSNTRGEELRSRAAHSHERSPSHICRKLEPVREHLKRRDEEFVARDRNRYKHVEHAEHVHEHRTIPLVLVCEALRRKAIPPTILSYQSSPEGEGVAHRLLAV